MPRQSRSGSSRSYSTSTAQSSSSTRRPVPSTPKPTRSSSSTSRSTTGTPTPAPVYATAPVYVEWQRSFGFSDGFDFYLGMKFAEHFTNLFRRRRTETKKSTVSSEATTKKTFVDPSCAIQFKDLQDCLNDSATDISKCQFYMDVLSQCRKSEKDAPATNLC